MLQVRKSLKRLVWENLSKDMERVFETLSRDSCKKLIGEQDERNHFGGRCTVIPLHRSFRQEMLHRKWKYFPFRRR